MLRSPRRFATWPLPRLGHSPPPSWAIKKQGNVTHPNPEPQALDAQDVLDQTAEGTLRVPPANANERVLSSIEYMKQDLSKPFSLTSLSAHAALSPSYYSALFKRQTGHSPMEFLTLLRIEEARRLLCETRHSIKAISHLLGYADPLYFSRVFRSMHQLSPRQYRKAQAASATRHAVEASSETSTPPVQPGTPASARLADEPQSHVVPFPVMAEGLLPQLGAAALARAL